MSTREPIYEYVCGGAKRNMCPQKSRSSARTTLFVSVSVTRALPDASSASFAALDEAMSSGTKYHCQSSFTAALALVVLVLVVLVVEVVKEVVENGVEVSRAVDRSPQPTAKYPTAHDDSQVSTSQLSVNPPLVVKKLPGGGEEQSTHCPGVVPPSQPCLY